VCWSASRCWRGAGRDEVGVEAAAQQALEAERSRLLEELRELDDDAAAGRISRDDRQAGRRGIAPRLRAVTEALRARGVELRAGRVEEQA
jgi:hypothetical protein